MSPTRSGRAPRRGFTLLELLVVVGLISTFSFIIIGALNSGRGSSLQAAQGVMANLLVATRSKATAANQSARLLLNFNPASADRPSRYLRYLVLQVQKVDGTWQTLADAYLPDGIYVVPGLSPLPAGLLPATSGWTRPSDGQVLRSSAMRTLLTETIDVSSGAESWLALNVTANGQVNNSNGDIVLAVGITKAPGTFSIGEPPIVFTSQEQVRGLTVSSYGVATLVSDRAGF